MNKPETNLTELWLEVAEAQGSAQEKLSAESREVINQKLLVYLSNPQKINEEEIELLDRACAPVDKLLTRVHQIAKNVVGFSQTIAEFLHNLDELSLLYADKIVKQNKIEVNSNKGVDIDLLNRSRSDLHMNFYERLLWMFEIIKLQKNNPEGGLLISDFLLELQNLGMSQSVTDQKIFTVLKNYGDVERLVAHTKDSQEINELVGNPRYHPDNILQAINWDEAKANLALTTVLESLHNFTLREAYICRRKESPLPEEKS